jgi:cytochrome c oxidase assembly protein subunit 15
MLNYLLIAFTMLYGGFVAGLKAGLIYNTFPMMDGQWIPDDVGFYNVLYVGFFVGFYELFGYYYHILADWYP